MLDRAVCSTMELGEPRVSVAVLYGLQQMLVARRFHANSPDDFNIVREKRDEQAVKGQFSADAPVDGDAAPDEHEVRQRRTSGNERGAARRGDHVSRKPVDTGRGKRGREGA